MKRWTLLLLFFGLLSATAAVQQLTGVGTDDTGPYTPVEGWLKPVKPGTVMKGAFGVFAESPDRVFATYLHDLTPPAAGAGRGAAPVTGATHFILVLDRNGKTIEEWSQWYGLFKDTNVHFVTESPYDPEKNVWIIDRQGSQIFKFTHDGKKLLMTLGEHSVSRTDETHFGRVASIAFMPDGSFYAADGYDGKRVAKFDKNGKFMFQWGSEGTGPSQFAKDGQVHGISIDSQHRIYIGDRGNKRVQIFDEKGKYLSEWDNIQGPSDVKITADGYAWVVSGVGNRVAKYDLTGKLITYWGMYGSFQGGLDNPHYLSVDSEGSLYLALSGSNNKAGIEKYVPKPNADKSRLVGPLYVVK